MKTNLSKRMDWASASIGPTREVLDPVVRTLHDLPEPGSTEGTREVAQLAAWRAAQEFAYQPVMEALTKLRDRVWDPEQPFLLADSVEFSWKTAPVRRYASFEDFYRRELESTWGKWSVLQADWEEVVAGRLPPEIAEERFFKRRTPAEVIAEAPPIPPRERGIKGGQAGPGRGKKTATGGSRLSHGGNPHYLAARIRQEAPEIADRIKDFPSVRAAAKAAGIVKTESPLTIVRRVWKKADPEQRREIAIWVSEQELD